MNNLQLFTLAGKPKTLGGFWDSIYKGYDYITPDFIQPEKIVDFVVNDAFDADFWKRQGNQIKNDPWKYSIDMISRSVPDVSADVVKYAAGEINEWVKNELRETLKANYGAEIENYIKSQKSQIKDLKSEIKPPSEYVEDVAIVSASAIGVGAGAVFGPWAIPVAGGLAYDYSKKLIKKLWGEILNKVKRWLFPAEVKRIQTQMQMAQVPVEKLKMLDYADFDENTLSFKEIELPVIGLNQSTKNFIKSTVARFKPIFIRTNNDWVKAYEELSEYVFFQTFFKTNDFRYFVEADISDGNNEKQAQNYIAITIWNERARALNEFIKFATTHTGVGYAAYMTNIQKKAEEMFAVLGRWKGQVAQNEFKKKLAEDRRRWAEEASRQGSVQSMEQEVARIQNQENTRKVLTWGAGLALVSMLL